MYYEEASDPSYWQYYVLMFVVSTIVMCVLLNTMANLAERISPDLRTLDSSQVWISIIPVFGSFWIFHVVIKLSNMLRDEFARRKIVEFETSPGLSSGLGFCFTLFIAQITLLFDTPVLAVVLYITAIALLAVYWSKLAAYTRKMDFPHHQQSQQQNQWQYPSQWQSGSSEPQHAQQWQYPPQPQYNQWQQSQSGNTHPQQTPNDLPPPQWQYPPAQNPPPPSPPPNEWERWKPR